MKLIFSSRGKYCNAIYLPASLSYLISLKQLYFKKRLHCIKVTFAAFNLKKSYLSKYFYFYSY